MVRPRRAAGARTLYERPRLANPKPENPNWLSRLIYSSTRTIATGAGKLLTNVFFPESSSSESESSSASSSADDSSSGMCVFLYTVMSTVRTIRFFFFCLNYLDGVLGFFFKITIKLNYIISETS